MCGYLFTVFLNHRDPLGFVSFDEHKSRVQPQVAYYHFVIMQSPTKLYSKAIILLPGARGIQTLERCCLLCAFLPTTMSRNTVRSQANATSVFLYTSHKSSLLYIPFHPSAIEKFTCMFFFLQVVRVTTR